MTREQTIAEVLEAESQWAQAHVKNDVATLERLMADEYAQISSDGRVLTRADVLASFAPGDRHWDEGDSDQDDVRLYGDTAVVIGRWRGRGVNAGQPFDYLARYVSVWVRRNGCWQMVTDQSTEIVGPPAPALELAR